MMIQRRTITRWPGLVLLAVSTLVGCDSEGKRPTHKVNGTLTVGGKPAGGAHLMFHAADSSQVVRSVGITNPDGSFRLTTYASGDGAPQGEYAVTIFWPDPSLPLDDCEGSTLVKNHDMLCGIYGDARKSTLKATIHAGSNEIVLKAADLSNLFKKPSERPHQAAAATP